MFLYYNLERAERWVLASRGEAVHQAILLVVAKVLCVFDLCPLTAAPEWDLAELDSHLGTLPKWRQPHQN